MTGGDACFSTVIPADGEAGEPGPMNHSHGSVALNSREQGYIGSRLSLRSAGMTAGELGDIR